MKATVHVSLKPSILDPQGEAVKQAIHRLGLTSVESARIGKFIELDLNTSDAKAVQPQLDQIAKDLLSNPVIEDYQIQIH